MTASVQRQIKNTCVSGKKFCVTTLLYFASSTSNYAASLNMSASAVNLPFTFQKEDDLDIIFRHLIGENIKNRRNLSKILKSLKPEMT